MEGHERLQIIEEIWQYYISIKITALLKQNNTAINSAYDVEDIDKNTGLDKPNPNSERIFSIKFATRRNNNTPFYALLSWIIVYVW